MMKNRTLGSCKISSDSSCSVSAKQPSQNLVNLLHILSLIKEPISVSLLGYRLIKHDSVKDTLHVPHEEHVKVVLVVKYIEFLIKEVKSDSSCNPSSKATRLSLVAS